MDKVRKADVMKNGFTLAEVLITLVVIGVVSALVIPSVLKNYNDKKYNTARLKALKTFGEAGKMASINGEINGQENARAFVENVLSKYLKIIKICDNAHPTDCGFPSSIQPSNPTANKLVVDSTHLVKWNQIGNPNWSSISSPVNDSTMSTIISTNDGFSAKIFYNPKCVRDIHEISTYYNVDIACMNAIYDMNGLKGPNHVGEDIGIVTVFWSGLNTISVAPGIIPYSINTAGTTSAPFTDAQNVCSEKGTSKIQYTMTNIDEASSLYTNNYLTSMPGDVWTSTILAKNSGMAWTVFTHGSRNPGYFMFSHRIWCVQR